MSDKATILDKLKEYEHTGSYLGAIEDVYALILHIADLEEEIDNLKEAADRRPVEGSGGDLPLELWSSMPTGTHGSAPTLEYGSLPVGVMTSGKPSVRGGRRTPSSTPQRRNRDPRSPQAWRHSRPG